MNAGKNLHLFVLLLLTVALTIGCKKGRTGPQGEQGEQGPDGNGILSGTGAPASSVGKDGDFYLDKSTSNFYGPKISGSWGSPVSLKGQAGAPGGNGSVILSGTSAPGTSLGKEGDYYLDKTNKLLYGPKSGTNWGAGLELKGTANVRSYIFNNPYTYMHPTIIGRFEFGSSANFPITDSDMEHGLTLAHSRFFDGSWRLINGDMGTGSFLKGSTITYSGVNPKVIVFIERQNGVDYPNVDAFRNETALNKIKIVVIPAGTMSSINRTSNRQEQMQDLLEPYLE